MANMAIPLVNPIATDRMLIAMLEAIKLPLVCAGKVLAASS